MSAPDATRARWEVIDVRGSEKQGWYYTISATSGAGKAGGGRDVPVTVKLTKNGRHASCATCLVADTCPHARFVWGVVEREGRPTEAR